MTLGMQKFKLDDNDNSNDNDNDYKDDNDNSVNTPSTHSSILKNRTSKKKVTIVDDRESSHDEDNDDSGS